MGDLGNEDRLDQYWPLSDLRARLATRFTLTDLAERTGGPARYVRLEETGQKIGFITPLTHNFCESCNRVRLTCTGQLYMLTGQRIWPTCARHCATAMITQPRGRHPRRRAPQTQRP